MTMTPVTRGPYLQRDGEERLLDVGRAGDPLAELVIRGVSDEERLALAPRPSP